MQDYPYSIPFQNIRILHTSLNSLISSIPQRTDGISSKVSPEFINRFALNAVYNILYLYIQYVQRNLTPKHLVE